MEVQQKGRHVTMTFPILPGTIARPILETTYINQPFDTSGPTWTSDRVGGNTFMSLGGAPWEWTPVLDPNNEYDADLTAVSGLVLQPDVSSKDNPFLHPFGFDYEFLVSPDRQYENLLAPRMQGEYATATQLARQRYNASAPGVIGMETDADLVPELYRAQEGDRVCLWGRWIIDTGHSDFHTEIHPPLVMVTARGIPAAGDPDHPQAGPIDSTVARIISRPYLVSQEYGDGALFEHLVKEVAKVVSPIIPLSLRVEAHPHVLTKPFTGVHLLNFTVRPPTLHSPLDTLMVTFHFTIRSGVAVQVARGPEPNSVTVWMVLNEVGYVPAVLPPKHDWSIDLDTLEQLNPDAGSVYRDVLFASILSGPAAPIILNRGILTDRYDAPRASSPGDTNITRMPVSALRGNTAVTVDNSQPFPVYGFVSLDWQPPVIARKPVLPTDLSVLTS